MKNTITETAMVHLVSKIEDNLFSTCGVRKLSYDTATDIVANWIIDNNIEII